MKNIFVLLLRIFIYFALIIGAFLWATRLMDSLYAFRSPLHNDPPTAGQPLLSSDPPQLIRRIVIVLVDALRVDTGANPDVMPTLDALRKKAAEATMHSRPPSYSDPGYSVLFTGAWPEISDGPAMNLVYEDTPTWTQDNLFSAAHRMGLKTAVSAFYWFEKLIPQSDVTDSFYTSGEDQVADRQVVDAALPWLQSAEYQLVLIHLDQVDYAGHHEGGPQDSRWNQAAQRADDLIAEILAVVDLDQDTLLVLSDHGQIDPGGHGGHEAIVLQEPFILAGAGVNPGQYGDIDMVDVAPTLAALLGVNIPASSQGQVRTTMLDLPGEVKAALPAALESQQSQLLEAYQTAIGSSSVVQPGEDIVAVHQAALEAARKQRLQSERLPRFLLSFVIALLSLGWFVWKRLDELAWFLVAGVIYLVLFNLRYAVIDGRTYSLSSVSSANDLILYTFTTAALALLIGWLVIALLRKVFKRTPAQAALWSLDLALFVTYLLALPVLWSFALNGTQVTWTLPDFPSMFLGFLSLIQILAVALIGLLLAGVASLVSRLVKKSK